MVAADAVALEVTLSPAFCRHNRFVAECPICSKGTVLDPNPAASRRAPAHARARAGGTRRTRQARPIATRPRAGRTEARGPYDGAEVRLERVPGGLRLASGAAAQIERSAPDARRGRPARPARRAAAERTRSPRRRAAATASRERARSRASSAPAPGRTGELRDELRVEPLDDGRVRMARWVMRPNRGWELQEAPVMLPPARFAAGARGRGAQGRAGLAREPSRHAVRASSDHADVPLTLVTGPANAAKAGEVLGGLRDARSTRSRSSSCPPSRTWSTPSASWPTRGAVFGAEVLRFERLFREIARARRLRRADRLRRPARADRRAGGPAAPAWSCSPSPPPSPGSSAPPRASWPSSSGSMVEPAALHPGAARVGRRRPAAPLRRRGGLDLPRATATGSRRPASPTRSCSPGAPSTRCGASRAAGAPRPCSSTASTTSPRWSSTRSRRSPSTAART